MIAKIKGTVDSIDDDSFCIEVQGIGYLVQTHSRLLSTVTVGESYTVYTETKINADEGTIKLFGFESFEEKQVFNLITSVQGVGARVGMAILSSFTSNDIINTIMSGDSKHFETIKGIGNKVATRLVLELKDKVAKMPVVVSTKSTISPTPNNASISDVTLALQGLGYKPQQAKNAAMMAFNQLDKNEHSTANLIKLSLQILSEN